MAGPVLDPDVIAQVLVDATALGDEAAARKHGISTRTIGNYRARLRGDPEGEIAGLFAIKRKAISERWLKATADARDKLLAKVLTLVEQAEAEQLRDVVGALKIVHDANVSERVIADGLGSEGTGEPVPDPTPAPFAGAARVIGERLGH